MTLARPLRYTLRMVNTGEKRRPSRGAIPGEQQSPARDRPILTGGRVIVTGQHMIVTGEHRVDGGDGVVVGESVVVTGERLVVTGAHLKVTEETCPVTGEHRIVIQRSTGPLPAVGPRRAELMRSRFVDGDRDAFDELTRPHINALYTLCLRVVGNEQEAEDLAQLALVKALEARERFDPERAFRPWLFRITLNVCRDRLRTVWWSRMLPLAKAPEENDPSPELLTVGAQRDAMVRHALSTLPRKYREAVALFHLEDMSYAEMSEITNASVPALKQRVRRGLEMLGRAVERMYPELVHARTNDENGAQA